MGDVNKGGQCGDSATGECAECESADAANTSRRVSGFIRTHLLESSSYSQVFDMAQGVDELTVICEKINERADPGGTWPPWLQR